MRTGRHRWEILAGIFCAWSGFLQLLNVATFLRNCEAKNVRRNERFLAQYKLRLRSFFHGIRKRIIREMLLFVKFITGRGLWLLCFGLGTSHKWLVFERLLKKWKCCHSSYFHDLNKDPSTKTKAQFLPTFAFSQCFDMSDVMAAVPIVEAELRG